MTLIVASAISSSLAWSEQSAPWKDHARFEEAGLQHDAVPTELLVHRARSVATLTSSHLSRLCDPSISTSGSTTGVMPASCARAGPLTDGLVEQDHPAD